MIRLKGITEKLLGKKKEKMKRVKKIKGDSKVSKKKGYKSKKKIITKKREKKREKIKREKTLKKGRIRKKSIKEEVGKKKVKRKIKRKKDLRKFLEDERKLKFLLSVVGEEGMEVVNRIIDEEVSDVELAETMDMKPNIIRKHLYALYEAGVVTYRRYRSKTGWYTYYWKLHPERISKVLKERALKEISELEKLIEHEKEHHFYECKNKCTRLIFEDAAEQNFKCLRCNTPLYFIDNKRRIKNLENKIEKLHKEVRELEKELNSAPAEI